MTHSNLFSWIVKCAHSTVYLLFLAKAHLVPGSPACESLGHSPHTVVEIEGRQWKMKMRKKEMWTLMFQNLNLTENKIQNFCTII